MVIRFLALVRAVRDEWSRAMLVLRYPRSASDRQVRQPAPVTSPTGSRGKRQPAGRTWVTSTAVLEADAAETLAGKRVNLAWLDRKDLSRRRVQSAREIVLTACGLAVTGVATVFLSRDLGRLIHESAGGHLWVRLIPQIAFATTFLFLIYGNVLYQVTRIGYVLRLRRHRPASDDALDTLYDHPAPAVTVVIPSYKEELEVIEQSLLSTALQEYPNRRVVLLIDDPHDPATPADAQALAEARRLPRELAERLAVPCKTLQMAEETFQQRARGALDLMEEIENLRGHLLEVAAWFRAEAERFTPTTHTNRLFIDLTFHRRALLEESRAHALASRLITLSDEDSQRLLRREYARLASLFDVELTSFERKRYANLSHAPNKAMNLNSYISLLGGTFTDIQREDGTHLAPTARESATFTVPWADFVLTLDADSFLDPSYTLRLVHVMQQPQHARTAVIQTPYSAVPHPPRLLERIAGATTDMQYLIHQGFTACGATFWVGANALLRKVALDDIVTTKIERGYVVRLYVQDWTVIEDTESSVDLILRHWQLHNYPERLSYSATPSDFGALIIQRRRWANGGLLILPKLLHYLRGRWLRRFPEGFMRIHYLISPAAVNLGVLLILMYPLEKPLRIAWLPLTALPYYLLYGRDLVLAGYRWIDLFRVYALNLLLIPVNLGGVLKSLQQAVTGRTIPFSRTPKVAGRTTAPPTYVLCELLLIGYCLVGASVDAWHGRWMHALFALINAGILGYAFARFVGFREGLEDLRLRTALARYEPLRAAAGTQAGFQDAPLGVL